MIWIILHFHCEESAGCSFAPDLSIKKDFAFYAQK